MLKTVEDLKRQPQPDKKEREPEKPVKKEPSFDEMIAKALAPQPPQQRPVPNDPTRPLTISEIDLVRQQIAQCWSLPVGAKDAANLVIDIGVEMNPDGTVRTAQILDSARLSVDPFFRAAAESALRAVNNPRCSPFRLPADKYDRWKTMTLSFNPKEMFGT